MRWRTPVNRRRNRTGKALTKASAEGKESRGRLKHFQCRLISFMPVQRPIKLTSESLELEWTIPGQVLKEFPHQYELLLSRDP